MQPYPHMLFRVPAVNDSPLGGREGTQLTGTMISERLMKEASSNISLLVMPAAKMEVRNRRCLGSITAADRCGSQKNGREAVRLIVTHSASEMRHLIATRVLLGNRLIFIHRSIACDAETTCGVYLLLLRPGLDNNIANSSLSHNSTAQAY